MILQRYESLSIVVFMKAAFKIHLFIICDGTFKLA